MALSGMLQTTFYNPNDGARFAYRLYWSATQSIANNTSEVTVTAKLAGLRGTSKIISGHSSSQTLINLDGTSVTDLNNISLDGITEITLHTYKRTLTHNADGSRSFTLGGSQQINATFNGTYVGTVTIAQQTLTLDTIPRQSDFTKFSNFSSTASSFALTVRRKSTAFTHRLTLKIGSTTIKQWTGQADLDSLPLTATEHTAVHNALPTSESATVSLVLETMSGSTVIGTQTRTATVTVASTIKPSLSSLTATERVSAVSSLLGTGNFAQSLSEIRLQILGAVAGQGSSITAYEIVWQGTAHSASQKDVIPTTAGSLIAKARVKDGRNRWSGYTEITVNVLPYSPPTLTGVQIRRASDSGGTVDEEGDRLRVDRSAEIKPLIVGSTAKNQLTLKIESKLKTSGTWSTAYTYTWPAGTNSITGFTVSTGAYSLEQTYDVQVTVSDKFQSVSAVGSLSSLKKPLILGFDNVGVGKVPTGGITLDVGGVLNVDGTFTAGGSIVENGRLVLSDRGMYSPTSGVLIDIMPATTWQMILVEVRGNGYSGDVPIHSIFQVYHYDTVGSFLSATQTNLSGKLSNGRFGVVGGRLKLWFPHSGPYQTFVARAYGIGGVPLAIGIGDSTLPAFTHSIVCGLVETYNTDTVKIFTSTSGGTARCVRYPNGWQELTWIRTLTTTIQQAVGANFFSNSRIEESTWPWAFVEQPAVSVACTGQTQVVWPMFFGSASATVSPIVYLMKGTADSNSRAYQIHLTARGRWK